MACAMSSKVLDGVLTSSELAGNFDTSGAVEDVWPIIEFTNASGQNTLMFQRPDLQEDA